MSDAMNFSWQMIAVAAAVFLVIRRVFRRRREASTPAQRPSLSGRVGSHLIAQAVISAVSGVLGFNVILACFTIALAIPLMLIGAKVELPDFVKAWPRSVAARVRGAFSDAKESAAPKDDGGELAQADGEEGEDADAFWGGPRDPSPSLETQQDEFVAFDAMPPDRKLATLRFAEPVDASSVPKGVNDLYVGESRYRIRCGRSACIYLTAAHRTVCGLVAGRAGRSH